MCGEVCGNLIINHSSACLIAITDNTLLFMSTTDSTADPIIGAPLVINKLTAHIIIDVILDLTSVCNSLVNVQIACKICE